MRIVLARFAVSGLLGIALAGCSGGSGLSPGGLPNDSGGGSVPVSTQAPPASTISGPLIDGGVLSTVTAPLDSYSGINTTATDAQSTMIDAGTDPASSSGIPPADPAGSHVITFSGSGVSQVIFGYNGTLPALDYSTTSPGQIFPINYGAIVLYAAYAASTATPLSTSTPTVAIELTGGSNATSYDVRITCGLLASKNASAFAPLQRYVCDLPAYGATAGTTATTTLVAKTSTEPAITSVYNVDTNIGNPRIADPTGSFTPGAAKLYVELIFPSPTLSAGASPGNTLDLDYVYAEAGTK
jgi:hypothetical protein